MGNDKKIIEEVCIIRLFLIILLVLYHAFAPYCGSWDPIESIKDYSDVYWWIGKTTYSCMLESFTLISGWVMGFQYKNNRKIELSLKNIIQNKLKRLIIPSIVFSLIYILIFNPHLFYDPLKLIYSALEGYGHMWYLPMLFWCFIGIVLVEKSRITALQGIILFSVLSILSYFHLPLRLKYTMYYMVFFYGGYIIGKQSLDIKRLVSIKYILFFLLCYGSIFIFTQLYFIPMVQLNNNISIEHKIIGSITIRIFHFLYAWCGTIAIVLISMFLIQKCQLKISTTLVKIGTLTFGIYIFQQFILKWLYYHTIFVNLIPDYLIPWIAFGITLILSFFATILLRSNKYGRYLIG